jgi:hypothetical protein
VLPRASGPVPPECDQEATAPPVQRVEIPKVIEERDTSRDLEPPPSRDLRSQIRAAQAAAEGNDRDAFKEALAAVKATVSAYPPGGERSAAMDVIGVYDDLARLWDYQFNTPTGSFFDATSGGGALLSAMNKYRGYEEFVRRQIIVDANGTRIYPTRETREFLTREAAQRLSRLGFPPPPRIRTAEPPRVATITPPRTTVAPSTRPAEPPSKPPPVTRRTTKRVETRPAARPVSRRPEPGEPAGEPAGEMPALQPGPSIVAPPPPTTTTAPSVETIATQTTVTETTATETVVSDTVVTDTTTTTAPAKGKGRNIILPLMLILIGIGVLIVLFRASS